MKTWKQVLNQRIRGRGRGLSEGSYGKARAIGSAPYGCNTQKLSGPAMKKSFIDMAEDVFDLYEYGEKDCEVSYSEDEEIRREIKEGAEPYQLSLPLFSVEEQQQHLDSLIRKYEVALEKMGEYALKWVALERTAESNQQFAKMFRDLKMMQKLVSKDSF